MKTDWEEAAEKFARRVREVLLEDFEGDLFEKTDLMAIVCYKVLSDSLKRKRLEVDEDFKSFCKSHKLTQYKVKDIEEGRIYNVDPNVFEKYIKAISAEDVVKDWIAKFPSVAKKYGLA